MKKWLRTLTAAALGAALAGAAALPAFAAAPGDVDKDEKVTASDARLALRCAVGLEDYASGSEEFVAADVDFDEKVTASDARLILRAAVGLEELADRPAAPTDTEYDTLRSGVFNIVATMEDSDGVNPMNMAVGSDGAVYLDSDMDGVRIGILIRKEGWLIKTTKMYMINHADKTYTDATAISMVIPDFDLAAVSTEIDSSGFTALPTLSEATTVEAGEFEGTACTVYTFVNAEDGRQTKVYLQGKKLVAIEQLDAAGRRVSVMRVESISTDFPAFPPKGYTEKKLLAFMTDLAGGLEP